jgi:hypothetical protein
MSHVRGEDRGQTALLPSALEDYVTADGPVRVIDAFVDGLDVSGLGFGRAAPSGTGRAPYDPGPVRTRFHAVEGRAGMGHGVLRRKLSRRENTAARRGRVS